MGAAWMLDHPTLDASRSYQGMSRPSRNERLWNVYSSAYSPPMWAPFSATERFISSTVNSGASVTTANSRKTSK